MKYLRCPFSIFDPPLSCKVGRLGTVETRVEARMIAVGKGDDEITRILANLQHYQNTIVPKRHYYYYCYSLITPGRRWGTPTAALW